jgi:hypothetical protein
MRRLRNFASFFWVITSWSAMVSTAPAQTTKAGDSPVQAISKPSGGQGRLAPNQLSDEECRDYALAVVNAAGSGNRAAFTAQIDWDALFDASLVNLALSDQQLQEFKKGLKSSIDSDTGFAAQLVKNSQQGGKFDFLRTRRNHGRQVVLFRMIQPSETGGVGYFEFVPKRFADGKIRAVDLYVFSTGEFISTTLRHALLPVIADLSRNFLSKLVIGEQAYVKDFPKLSNVTALINQGKMQEALAIIKGMQPETQQMKKDFPQALESIDRLDKAVGGDPHLNVVRAGISEKSGDLAAAARFAGLAMEQEPTLLTAYFTAIGISLKAAKYDETLAGLKALDQKFKMQFNDMKTVPEYAGFVKSPQYPQWLSYLAQKGKPQQPKKSQSNSGVGKSRMSAPTGKSNN